ncbi:MAG: 6-bladed beta-propeller [Prevotellaceae bacterium]|jgi:hypothetical protein|nr:6-bladed beta-propeller [Prevotellaceae bacterium]
MKKITVILVLWFYCGCSGCSDRSVPSSVKIQNELNLITDSAVTVKILSCIRKNFEVSKLIDSVRYIALENTDEALIGIVRQIKVTKNFIYVLDLNNDDLKCFDKCGKFIRNVYTHGGGPEEIGRFHDFDIDENYVYILDGAKIAIQVFDHDGNYIEKRSLPFRAQKLKCLADEGYLFELSPFGITGDNSDLTVLTDMQFQPVKYLLQYIEDTFTGIDFENSTQSVYLYATYGNSIFERRGNQIFMKYYLDFGGKYFNSRKDYDGFQQAVEQEIYFTSTAPVHNNGYLMQSYYAGLQREGSLLISLADNKAIFIKNLIQDRNDVINFTFARTRGYDPVNNEFFGTCGVIDLANITSDDRDTVISELKKFIPENVQPYLLQNDMEKNTNYILMFYKLKTDIDME